ncbi:STAS domain-containing protein [Gordonia hankookensis]|uniref:STAS domain-containing protein n=1 Tax=Gordonia hankookensis TaxID=589403 RepID=A0ABR7WIB9_9ACTN|nr:STAS domain-containing protein [Gordonia hankookensis]MBD1322504.1 STAS domain-containing protein [Gordonia hankookensis]
MSLDSHITFRDSPVSAATERPAAGNLTAARTICVQQFSGEIDLQSVADFAVALDRLTDRRPECVLLDLLQVRFLSTSGLAVLGKFCDDAARRRIPVAVACGRVVARPVEACRLDDAIDLHHSLEEAGRSLTSVEFR